MKCQLIDSVVESFQALTSITGLFAGLLCASQEAHEKIEGLQKKLAESDRRHKHFTQQLTDSLTDMVWAKAPTFNGDVIEYRYIYANKAIKELLLHNDNPIGKTDVEIQSENSGQDLTDIVCSSSDEVVYKEFVKRLEEHESTRFSMKFLEHILVKGNDMYLEVIKTPMFDLQGHLLAIIGSGRITDHKEVVRATAGMICEDSNLPICKKYIFDKLNQYAYEPNSSKPVESFNIDKLINQFRD